MASSRPHDTVLVDPAPAELLAIHRQTAAEWAMGLSVDEYLGREAALFAHPWARRFLRKRVLRERASGKVLASFDALETESADGPVLTIASVFVEPAHRGRNLARRLLELALAEAAASRFAWAVLYSDIGVRFYEKLGFRAGPTRAVVFDARRDSAGVGASASASALERAEPLDTADLAPAIDEIRRSRTAILDATPDPVGATSRPPRRLVLLPTPGFAEWHLERFRYFARIRRSPWRGPLGARLESGSLALWAPCARDQSLVILALVERRPEDRVILLELASADARHRGLAEVVVWLDGTAGGLESRTIRETRDFVMARPLGSGRGDAPWTWGPVERIDWA